MALTLLGNIAVIEPHPFDSVEAAEDWGATEESLVALEAKLADAPEGTQEVAVRERPDLGKQITTYVTPGTLSAAQSFIEIETTWDKFHSNDAPEWVESDSEVLAELIADHYGCQVGRSEDWDK